MANFRTHTLKSGRVIFAGKNAQNNDELVNLAHNEDIILHTEKPSSPFVNVGKKPSKEEIIEAAAFCARYSKDWKTNRNDVVVHIFKRKYMKKDKNAKEGAWLVKKAKKINIKKEVIEGMENNLRIQNG